MEQQKYYGVRKSDIEFIKTFGLEMRKRKILLPVGFKVFNGGWGKMSVEDSEPVEYDLGKMLCDLASALEEVESLIEVLSNGKPYKQEDSFFNVLYGCRNILTDDDPDAVKYSRLKTWRDGVARIWKNMRFS